ncbi:MAG: DNA-processing protein DprA [Patescibacteria group bacterium]
MLNYAAALCYFPKFSIGRGNRLLEAFPNPEEIWKTEIHELISIGIDPEIANEFMAWREIAPVEKITRELIKLGIKTVSISDPVYPKLLREISDPPAVLFYRGELPDTNLPLLSVVGTRRCTAYGKKVTEDIVKELAEAGVGIVSGLAFGIDGIAHHTALKNGGKTFAVLGSGVDRPNVTPSSHQSLADEILATGGGIISEYLPGLKPTAYSFQARNRIIAGLSMATLVTEAPLTSGALITAARCLDYNRDVLVIPHPINSLTGAGCNFFLKKGAQLITSASDILEILHLETLKTPKRERPLPKNITEEKIYAVIANGPKHIDEIIKLTQISASSLTGTLTILELEAKVKNLGGMTYQWA